MSPSKNSREFRCRCGAIAGESAPDGMYVYSLAIQSAKIQKCDIRNNVDANESSTCLAAPLMQNL